MLDLPENMFRSYGRAFGTHALSCWLLTLNMTNTEQNPRWVIFDADNTLWDVETLYNTARAQMCSFVSKLAGTAVDEIERFQQQRDADLEPIYGYSSARFARSFEDTIYHFLPQATAEQVRHARGLAESVFSQKANLVDNAELVLRSLHAAKLQNSPTHRRRALGSAEKNCRFSSSGHLSCNRGRGTKNRN